MCNSKPKWFHVYSHYSTILQDEMIARMGIVLIYYTAFQHT